ncbi:MAG: TonB-dependent receptor [Colwellia sp.]|nr:TonB-dependent receptor [Colwellia sp.]
MKSTILRDIKTSVFLYFCCFNLTAVADVKQPTSDNHLEHIVVSGTRTPKLLSNSPVSIQVIEQETIQILTQGTLAGALNYIPGVVVTRNVKSGYNIQMQGFDGDHVLVLINSQPLISPAGSAADLDQINANEIEQIEVLRGAASVMYGSSAMGGVINIITKDYDENQAKVSMQVGHYADAIDDDPLSYTARVNASLTTDDWDYKISLLHIDDAGFDYDPSTIKQDASGMEKSFINISTKSDSLNLLTNHKVTAEIKYQYLHEDKSRPDSVVPGQDSIISYLSEVEQNQIDFSLSTAIFNNEQHQIQQGSWQLNARYVNHQETSGQSNSIRDTDIDLAEINGQYIFSRKELEIVSGGVIHVDSLEQIKPVSSAIEIDDESRKNIDAFIQANWIEPNYQILAGMRSQYDSDFGFHSAASVSTLHKFGDKENQWQWRNGFGQGYRVPSLKERFYIFDHSNLGYMVLGSTDLKAEEANTINTTLSYNTELFTSSNWFNQAQLNVEVNAHYAKTKNFIETVRDAEKSAETQLDISVYQNIARATIQGLDFSFDLTFNEWSGQINYSYLDARNEDGQRLTERPYHQLKTNITYRNYEHELDVLFYFVYQSNEAYGSSYSQVVNNHWVNANINLNQSINEQLSWNFAINNLFNEHKDADANSLNAFDSRPVSSRNLTLGMQYKF